MTVKQSIQEYADHLGYSVSEAIHHAIDSGLTIGKYADPVEGARTDLTADEATSVAGEDCGLLYVLDRAENTPVMSDREPTTVETMSWSSDQLVRDIASELDDRDLSEIAESIMAIFADRAFEEPQAVHHFGRDQMVAATTLASQIVDWANYAQAYGDYGDPPWRRKGDAR